LVRKHKNPKISRKIFKILKLTTRIKPCKQLNQRARKRLKTRLNQKRRTKPKPFESVKLDPWFALF